MSSPIAVNRSGITSLLSLGIPPRSYRVPCRPQPLRQRPKPVELRAMTLCIAAQFRLGPPYVETAQAAFVLCTDGRLSGGAWGSDNAAIKTANLGYNFLGLMAGHWNTVRDFSAELAKDLQAAPLPPTKADLVQSVKASADHFSQSALCPSRVGCELIITGFIGDDPIIVKAAIANRRAAVSVSHDREEVGEGAFAARTLLHHRGYDPLNLDLARACYYVYEAKKFSETVDSVGPLTWLKVHAKGDGDTADPLRRCEMDISDQGMRELEEWRQKFFLQSTAELKGKEFRRFT